MYVTLESCYVALSISTHIFNVFVLLFSCQMDFRAIVIFYVIYKVTPLLFYSTAHEVLYVNLLLLFSPSRHHRSLFTLQASWFFLQVIWITWSGTLIVGNLLQGIAYKFMYRYQKKWSDSSWILQSSLHFLQSQTRAVHYLGLWDGVGGFWF